jgi:hypothetical protein
MPEPIVDHGVIVRSGAVDQRRWRGRRVRGGASAHTAGQWCERIPAGPGGPNTSVAATASINNADLTLPLR